MIWYDRLKKTLEDAECEGRIIDVFFRDDDADDDLPNLHRLLEMFLERNAPISLEIIPGTLTDEGAALLERVHRQAPELVELNQHGWKHTNHEQHERKCEFGTSRTYQEQLDDIRRGSCVLTAAFGLQWKRVFTPPWNRCTQTTIKALKQLGFERLSRDASAEPQAGGGLPELHTTIDIYSWKNGPVMKAPEKIFEVLCDQAQSGCTVGVLLHHKVMTEEAFGTTGRMLDLLCSSSAVRMHTLHSALGAGLLKEQSACCI